MVSKPLAELDAAEVLDAFEAWHAEQRDREVRPGVRAGVAADATGPPGQTDLGNLAPLTRWHHRIKTFGAWQVKQPFPGICLWRDLHGATYLVDHTGTRRTDTATRRTGSDPPDTTVEIYPGSHEIEYTPRHAA